MKHIRVKYIAVTRCLTAEELLWWEHYPVKLCQAFGICISRFRVTLFLVSSVDVFGFSAGFLFGSCFNFLRFQHGSQRGYVFPPIVVTCSFPPTNILSGQRAAGQLLNAKKRPTRHFWGETPLAGTNPWLEQNPSWNKPLAGTSSGLEQPSIKLEDEQPESIVCQEFSAT